MGIATTADEHGVLPVWVDVTVDRDRVRRFIETDLGWQALDARTVGLIPPVVRLVDAGTDVGSVDGTIPTVLLAANREEAAGHAGAVIIWPAERQRLPRIVGELRSRAASPHSGRVLHVGGTAGGVGTTTVALALAGIAGWQGLRALALVRGDVPVPGVRTAPLGAVGASDLYGRASPIPGVPPGRVLAVEGAGEVATLADSSVELAVVDDGVADQVDVLVARLDRVGLDSSQAAVAGSIVVVTQGPITLASFKRHIGDRRVTVVPWSARVARAGWAQRVPAGLPGSWLRPLAGLVGPGTGRA